MTESRRLKLDLITGYLLTATRVIAWAVIFGMLYRYESPEAAAAYAFVRSLVAFVPVFMLNIPNALYWRLSIPDAQPTVSLESPAEHEIHYASPNTPAPSNQRSPPQALLSAIICTTVIGIAVMAGYAAAAPWLGFLGNPRTDLTFVLIFPLVIAIMFRIMSDLLAVVLQRENRLFQDNLAVSGFELIPIIVVFLTVDAYTVAVASCGAALLLLCARGTLIQVLTGRLIPKGTQPSLPECRNLLRYGLQVSLSQAGDLLYAPVTLILLGGLAYKLDVATYSTLLQFDAALLLLTAAITTTLTPRVSNLLSANDPRTALRYTFKATGISLAILTAAAVTLYFTAQPILNLWLGQVPAGLLTVLPIFLIHTVIGGASAPLRAVLLLAGKAKQLTIANTLGGLAVATATFLILKYPTYTTQTTGLLPLQAIAAATALSVTLRCALWMPWYTRKVLAHK